MDNLKPPKLKITNRKPATRSLQGQQELDLAPRAQSFEYSKQAARIIFDNVVRPENYEGDAELAQIAGVFFPTFVGNSDDLGIDINGWATFPIKALGTSNVVGIWAARCNDNRVAEAIYVPHKVIAEGVLHLGEALREEGHVVLTDQPCVALQIASRIPNASVIAMFTPGAWAATCDSLQRRWWNSRVTLAVSKASAPSSVEQARTVALTGRAALWVLD
jgi:hypothetical protein